MSPHGYSPAQSVSWRAILLLIVSLGLLAFISYAPMRSDSSIREKLNVAASDIKKEKEKEGALRPTSILHYAVRTESIEGATAEKQITIHTLQGKGAALS
jgi:hypothetical protein